MKKINNYFLNENKSIRKAIKKLEQLDYKTIIVLDKFSKIIGTITDGDIRRGLIKNIKLEDKVNEIISKRFISTTSKIFSKKVLSLMVKNKINFIPVVNKFYKVIDIHFKPYFDTDYEIKNFFVIMAGGKGKRLKPITKNIPKPLIKINGKPIIEHIVKKASEENFKNFIVTTFYKSEKITKFLKKFDKNNYKINFIKEKKPLGTAGSLFYLSKHKYDSIIISNCDIISNLRYSDLLNYHKLNNADVTIATNKKIFSSPFGNVEIFNNKVSFIHEKPVFESNVSTGIYAIKIKNLKYLKQNTYCDMPDFINFLINKKKKVISFPIHEKWIDYGDKRNLKITI